LNQQQEHWESCPSSERESRVSVEGDSAREGTEKSRDSAREGTEKSTLSWKTGLALRRRSLELRPRAILFVSLDVSEMGF